MFILVLALERDRVHTVHSDWDRLWLSFFVVTECERSVLRHTHILLWVVDAARLLVLGINALTFEVVLVLAHWRGALLVALEATRVLQISCVGLLFNYFEVFVALLAHGCRAASFRTRNTLLFQLELLSATLLLQRWRIAAQSGRWVTATLLYSRFIIDGVHGFPRAVLLTQISLIRITISLQCSLIKLMRVRWWLIKHG